ncbi:MAG: N-acetylmuramoyl-L-alanine amidase [Desulfobacteraceae bacterium]|nr:N-acetylmuramoyl-L-alanine amidase [Desulfobacteraceae bacterium]MBC2755139.1 N-acetylmuramoyl-L-alanine amidase [Desulfobacteraceae bacterium]
MQAFDMIKIERNNKKSGVLTIFLLLIIALLTGSIKLSHAEKKDSKSVGIRTIVIDPGHGGHDQGAGGSGGSLEKDISLNFARILAKELKPDYEVVFTRNGDYQVTLTRRASVANHHRADMFISIHTGGGSRYQMDFWSIFYYQKTDQRNGGMRPEAVGPDNIQDNNQVNIQDNVEDLRLNWDHVQVRYQKKSRALAGCMKTQLAGNPEIREVTVSAAALRVLEGLDMPAIVIETGYLTNPKTEKRLNDISFLTDVAKSVKKGVDVYLTR